MDKFVLKPAPTTEVENTALPADVGAKLKLMVKEDSLTATLTLAYAYAKTVIPHTPMYVSGPFQTSGSIQEHMQSDPAATIMASATLQDIALEADALSTFDIARVQWMLTQHVDARSFKDAIGVITVNYNTVDSNCKHGRRLNKDAEIQALCLLIYWTQAPAFVGLATDLVIKYVQAGSASSSKAWTLRMINGEESKRKVRRASMIWKQSLFQWFCKGSSYVLLCVALICFTLLCLALLCIVLVCFALLFVGLLCFALHCFALLCTALLCFDLFSLHCFAFALLCFALLCFALLCMPLKIIERTPNWGRAGFIHFPMLLFSCVWLSPRLEWILFHISDL